MLIASYNYHIGRVVVVAGVTARRAVGAVEAVVEAYRQSNGRGRP